MAGARHGRASLYTGLVGVALGVLLTGLLVPLIDGDAPASSSLTTAGGGVAESGAAAPAGDAFVDTGAAPTPEGDAPADAPAAQPEGQAPAAATPTTAAPAASSAPLRATDQGVTATSIKVAFLLLDLGQTGRIGVNTTGVNPRQQQQAIEAYVKDINDRGGIGGRKIEPFFKVFDVTNREDQLAACLAATEDAKAFAVIAMPGYANDAVLCVTEQHRTPLIVTGQAVSREFYNRSQGRLVTMASAGDRLMRNWASELDRAGHLKGRTLGILTSETKNARDTVDGVLVPALKEAGHKVGHITHFSADQATASSQIPTEIQRMRAAGVDTVMITISFLTSAPFVQTAERQAWRPRYLQSEFSGGTSDFEVQAMPASFDGAVAMTSQRFGEWRSNVPEPPGDRRCRELYEKASGEPLPRNNGNQSNAAYNTLLYPCGMLRVFAAAATAAGPELTRDRFAAAVQSSPPGEPAIYFPGTFRRGKTDLNDVIRFNKFVHSCTCWRNVDAPRPARFR